MYNKKNNSNIKISNVIGLINRLDNNKTALSHIDVAYFTHKDIERHNAVKEVLALYGES
jgi:hypothetical protein